MCVSSLPQTPLPFRLPHDIEQSPLCSQGVLVSDPFQIQQCVHADPKLPKDPFPLPFSQVTRIQLMIFIVTQFRIMPTPGLSEGLALRDS